MIIVKHPDDFWQDLQDVSVTLSPTAKPAQAHSCWVPMHRIRFHALSFVENTADRKKRDSL